MHADVEQRHIPIEGTYNFRDTGGYRAGAGTTRTGVLYRSDALHNLTDAGVEALREREIGTVIDLRTVEERTKSPNRVGELPVTDVHAPIFESTGGSNTMGIELGLDVIYNFFVDDRGEFLARAIGLIAAASGPVVVHCTAGKDRTGMVIALALSAAGVGDDDVIANYAASQQYLYGEWADQAMSRLAAHGIEPTETARLFLAGTPPELMVHSLDRIRQGWGSVPEYLTAHGLEVDELAALTALLVTGDPVDAAV
ncbi:protein-tyrosine-phosphatase [Nocardia sp. SYP-A9097]|uniref:tyrosine-protein phosphatase n=1 Tax=Nocardia sp. SYP-A9097 TaxID=2663237 RepID=UPI00129B650D|nr:tyrosine-protein phosphatase [Nocardia sp. SYP-A9097]MRH90726.1 protein-tyrosine-phosphatase [Nocardia sp. SYP-A9097]